MNYYNFQTSTSVSLETISAVKRVRTNSVHTHAPAQVALCYHPMDVLAKVLHITTYQLLEYHRNRIVVASISVF